MNIVKKKTALCDYNIFVDISLACIEHKVSLHFSYWVSIGSNWSSCIANSVFAFRSFQIYTRRNSTMQGQKQGYLYMYTFFRWGFNAHLLIAADTVDPQLFFINSLPWLFATRAVKTMVLVSVTISSGGRSTISWGCLDTITPVCSSTWCLEVRAICEAHQNLFLFYLHMMSLSLLRHRSSSLPLWSRNESPNVLLSIARWVTAAFYPLFSSLFL